MADKDRKDEADKEKAGIQCIEVQMPLLRAHVWNPVSGRHLRKAVEIVRRNGLQHARAFSKLALYL